MWDKYDRDQYSWDTIIFSVIKAFVGFYFVSE